VPKVGKDKKRTVHGAGKLKRVPKMPKIWKDKKNGARRRVHGKETEKKMK
jgi:hypothetical protein